MQKVEDAREHELSAMPMPTNSGLHLTKLCRYLRELIAASVEPDTGSRDRYFRQNRMTNEFTAASVDDGSPVLLCHTCHGEIIVGISAACDAHRVAALRVPRKLDHLLCDASDFALTDWHLYRDVIAQF